MQVEEELVEFMPEQGVILAIGVFDGVHLGHKHLMDYLKRQALVRNLLSGVVTFRRHPQQVLSPQTRLPYLTSLEERIRLLQEVGVELVVPLSFTPELSQLSARHFIALLQKHLRMQGMVVGPDFALGQEREGDVSTLHSLGKEAGFTVDVVPPKTIDGEIVSSTAIRQALAQGEVTKVEKFLGRPFSLSGQVVYGAERGKVLGFPTSNLATEPDQALPADGVYVTRAYFGDSAYPSVTNVGERPTFGQGEQTIEVYLFDFVGELYGRELRIELVGRLREERHFSTPEELKAQITSDVEEARAILGR